MAQFENHEIQVLDKGIHCAGCEARIENVLSRFPGVQDVKADHQTQRIRLTLSPSSVAIQEVKEKLEDLGYSTE